MDHSDGIGTSSANHAPEKYIEDVSVLQKQIAVLEQEVFEATERHAEAERSSKDLSVENGILKSNISALEKEHTERLRILRETEAQRDDLLSRKNNAENQVALILNKATLYEGQIERLTMEKKYIADELDSVKKALHERITEKCTLQLQLDQFQQEKRNIEYEKERWKTEKDLYLHSKGWYNQEVIERDHTIAKLRIELGSLEARCEIEKSALVDERDQAVSKQDSAQEKITDLTKQLEELNAKMSKTLADRAEYMNDVDLELQAKDRIIAILREQGEEMTTENTYLQEESTRSTAVIENCKAAIIESAEKLRNQKEEFEKELQEKDKALSDLKAELDHANELLKSNCKVSERDIAELSPSAAQAARLIRGKVSLTAIYHEHTQALNRIEQLTEENKRLDAYVKEIIEEFEEKVPKFIQQKENMNRLEETCADLDQQLTALRAERDQLFHEKEATQRELLYTRHQLERFQVAHAEQCKQVKFLSYIMEKGDAPPVDGEDDILFRNIDELHQANVDLRDKLRSTQKDLDDAMANARNDEAQKNQKVVEHYEGKLRDSDEQIRLMKLNVEQLQEQVASYKQLAEQHATQAQEGSKAIMNIEVQQLLVEKATLQAAAESLRERFDTYRAERVKADEIYEQRIEQQMQLVSDLRAVRVKLESDIAVTLSNAKAANKQVAETDVELLKMRDRLEKLNSDKKLLEQKNEQLTQSLFSSKSETSQLRSNLSVLQSELEKERRNVQRMDTEVKILRSSEYVNEKLATTLAQMENRLKFVDEDRKLRTSTHFEALTVERNQLKTLLAQMNDELKRSTIDRDLERRKYEHEVETLKVAKKKVEQELSVLQSENISVKTKVSSLEKQFINMESLESGDPKASQQVINRNDYLETQVRDLEEKLDDALIKLQAKEKELETLKGLTLSIESSIKEQDEFSVIERNQLQSQLNGSQAALSESRDIITRLREEASSMEEKIANLEQRYERKKMELDAESQEFEKRLNQMERERDELACQVDDMSTKIVDQDDQVKVLLTVEQSLKQELSVVKGELQQKSQEVTKMRDEVGRANSELNVARYDHERLLKVEKDEVDKLRALVTTHEEQEKEHTDKVELLYNKIQELTKRLASVETLSSSFMDTSSTATEEYSPAASIDSMNLLIDYMRKEKAAAIDRSSSAELKLKSYVAQATIHQEKIDSLEETIRLLRVQVEVHLGELKEKNELVSRLSLLQAVQDEKANLEQQLSTLSQELVEKNQEIAKAMRDLRTAQNATSIEARKLADSNLDLETARKQTQEWKSKYQQLSESIGSNSSDLKSRNDVLSSQLRDLRKESEQANSKWQREKDFLVKKMESLRALARKYKEQVEQVQSEGSTDPENDRKIIAANQILIDQLRKERDDLAETVATLRNQLEQLEVERDEARFRLSCLESINSQGASGATSRPRSPDEQDEEEVLQSPEERQQPPEHQIADVSQSSSQVYREASPVDGGESQGSQRISSSSATTTKRKGSPMDVLIAAAMQKKRHRSSPAEVSTSSEVHIPAALPEAEPVEVEDDEQADGDEMPDAEEGDQLGDGSDVDDAGPEELPQVDEQEPDVVFVDSGDEEDYGADEARADANLPDDELDEDYGVGMEDFIESDDDIDLAALQYGMHEARAAHDVDEEDEASDSQQRAIPAEPVVYDIESSEDDDDEFGHPDDVVIERADSGSSANHHPDDENPEDPTSSPSRAS